MLEAPLEARAPITSFNCALQLFLDEAVVVGGGNDKVYGGC